jgi:hypothetical protein
VLVSGWFNFSSETMADRCKKWAKAEAIPLILPQNRCQSRISGDPEPFSAGPDRRRLSFESIFYPPADF